MIEIHHTENDLGGQFLIYDNNYLAGKLSYKKVEQDKIDTYHTCVKEVFQGKGYAGKLFFKVIEYAENQSVKIIPTCSFIRVMFQRNPQLQKYMQF